MYKIPTIFLLKRYFVSEILPKNLGYLNNTFQGKCGKSTKLYFSLQGTDI